MSSPLLIVDKKKLIKSARPTFIDPIKGNSGLQGLLEPDQGFKGSILYSSTREFSVFETFINVTKNGKKKF